MGKGDLDQLYIKGRNGYLLVMQAGPNAILLVSTTKDVRLGPIFLNFRSKDDDGDDRYPYPYIFKPPGPPDDFAMAPQLLIRPSLKKKEPEEEKYCQYCGIKLTNEEESTHSCKEKP